MLSLLGLFMSRFGLLIIILLISIIVLQFVLLRLWISWIHDLILFRIQILVFFFIIIIVIIVVEICCKLCFKLVYIFSQFIWKRLYWSNMLVFNFILLVFRFSQILKLSGLISKLKCWLFWVIYLLTWNINLFKLIIILFLVMSIEILNRIWRTLLLFKLKIIWFFKRIMILLFLTILIVFFN